jgi:ABC-2 type transport system ATP-binding protein
MGAQRVALRVGGDQDGVEEIVKKIPGVSRLQASPDGSMEYESSPGVETRPQVSRALVEAGYDMLELRAISLSLEDIFLQLTREEPPVPQLGESSED